MENGFFAIVEKNYYVNKSVCKRMRTNLIVRCLQGHLTIFSLTLEVVMDFDGLGDKSQTLQSCMPKTIALINMLF